MASSALRCLRKHMIRCEDIPRRRSPSSRAPQTCDHRPRVHAPVGVGLRVEEDLSMPHALRGSFLQVGPGQLVEVPLVEPYLGALEVEGFFACQPVPRWDNSTEGEALIEADGARSGASVRAPVENVSDRGDITVGTHTR